MKTDVAIGRLEQDRADVKIWFGKKLGNKIVEFEGNKDRLFKSLQVEEGLIKEDVAKELKKYEEAKQVFNTRTLEVDTLIQSQFDKLTHSDIKEIEGSLSKFANTVKEKYNTSQENANEKVKDFMLKI